MYKSSPKISSFYPTEGITPSLFLAWYMMRFFRRLSVAVCTVRSLSPERMKSHKGFPFSSLSVQPPPISEMALNSHLFLAPLLSLAPPHFTLLRIIAASHSGARHLFLSCHLFLKTTCSTVQMIWYFWYLHLLKMWVDSSWKALPNSKRFTKILT